MSGIAAAQNAAFVMDSVVEVDPEAHTIRTAVGDIIPYDVLVVATGSRMAACRVP